VALKWVVTYTACPLRKLTWIVRTFILTLQRYELFFILPNLNHWGWFSMSPRSLRTVPFEFILIFFALQSPPPLQIKGRHHFDASPFSSGIFFLSPLIKKVLGFCDCFSQVFRTFAFMLYFVNNVDLRLAFGTSEGYYKKATKD